MLLGSTANNQSQPNSESLVIQLLLQQRYAEAYDRLVSQQPTQNALYNMAVCLHWAGNYEAALSRLDHIQPAPQLGNANGINSNSEYSAIRLKQNQTNDHLQGLTEVYIKTFPALAQDAIIRLKTDCWLKLDNYDKVRAIATPIASKGYKNITDALELAKKANDERI